jgi:hypothetical protein
MRARKRRLWYVQATLQCKSLMEYSTMCSSCCLLVILACVALFLLFAPGFLRISPPQPHFQPYAATDQSACRLRETSRSCADPRQHFCQECCKPPIPLDKPFPSCSIHHLPCIGEAHRKTPLLKRAKERGAGGAKQIINVCA